MADVKLKDKTGEEITYTDITSIDLPLADGSGTATFSLGGRGGIVESGYTVTFQSDGASYAVFSVTAGDSVNAPNTPPTKSGYTFVGWGSSLVVTTNNITFPYTPTEDTTIYAIYSTYAHVGFSGLTNSSGELTWLGDLASLQSSAAYTTSDSGQYTNVTLACRNFWPFSVITTVTDDNSNVFRRFPKMWVKLTNIDSKIDQVEFSDQQLDSDYFVWDCFLNPSMDYSYLDYVDIGTYEGSGSSSKVYSKSGQTCLTDITRANCRTGCRAYDTISNYYNGYQQLDITMFSFYNFLVMCAYRTSNILTVYGGRTGAVSGTSWSSAATTGQCDGLSGDDGWDNTSNCVKMLGIENPYGNIFKWVDGIYFSSSTVYYHRWPTQFADSTTNAVSTGVSRPTSSSWLTGLAHGTATTTKSCVYASAASGGSSSVYFGDYEWYNSSGTVLYVGGYWDYGSDAGLWSLFGFSAASAAASDVGCRLCRRVVS